MRSVLRLERKTEGRPSEFFIYYTILLFKMQPLF